MSIEHKPTETKAKPTPTSASLDMEIQDQLGDVNEFLWLYHGRPQWVLSKLRFCPYTLVQEDVDQTKALLEKVPDLEQLSKFRAQMVGLTSSVEQQHRLVHIDRAIENVGKVKAVLAELISRVQAELSKKAKGKV